MTPIIGELHREADGRLAGILRALILRTHIELRPVGEADGHRLFAIIVGPEFQAGVARQALEPATAPIDLEIRSPDLAAPIAAQALSSGGDHWTIFWRPDG